MLIKFNVSNVSITEVHTDITNNSTENTTLKIDSITLEQEVAPEEIGTLMNSITNIAKDVITATKKNNTDKRYHVTKYQIDGIWECQKYHQYIIIKDKKNNITKIIFLFENGDSLTRTLDDTHYKMYNKQKYIISEYDSDVIEL